MADWTDLNTNTLLPGEPVTSAMLLAFEEKPRAIAEGATGAPKIADKIVSGSGTTTVSGLDDFGGMIIRAEGLASGTGSTTLDFEIEYSTNGGSTFSSPQTLFTITDGTGTEDIIIRASLQVYIDFSSAAYKGVANAHVGSTPPEHLTGTVTGLTSDVTDIRLSGFDALLINPQGGDTTS